MLVCFFNGKKVIVCLFKSFRLECCIAVHAQLLDVACFQEMLNYFAVVAVKLGDRIMIVEKDATFVSIDLEDLADNFDIALALFFSIP